MPHRLLTITLLGCAIYSSRPVRGGEPLVVPWGRETFVPGTGCRWDAAVHVPDALVHNAHYLAPPAANSDWRQWLDLMRAYRTRARAELHAGALREMGLQFDGVRAWIRVAPQWAAAIDLVPGESVTFAGQVRWLAGHNRLGAALDYCDRQSPADAVWRGWSTVLKTTDIPQDGQWHRFEITWQMPPWDHVHHGARPILGMDGTDNPRKSSILLRNVELQVPCSPQRAARLASLPRPGTETVAYNDAIYARPDLAWMTRNFVCGFVFMYDRAFWDPDSRQYQVRHLCTSAEQEFGGFDSVVLWHDYPRIGTDARNQFDFFRDMPGGLDGLRNAVAEFHERNVKVFIPYMPWDTGTRREAVSDEQALAQVVGAINADGVFLDTMKQAPAHLRAALDQVRPGVALEPEIHPEISELEQCSGSWAQGLQAFPRIGVLHLKWLEPRHMQHQIRRWDRSHDAELAAAWLNGSGVLVWENVFGSFNPWNRTDRATLRRMAPVWRHFADLWATGQWQPCFPTARADVSASCWEGPGVRVWTLLNESTTPLSADVVLDVPAKGQQFYDLWSGRTLTPEREADRCRLRIGGTRFGAVAAVNTESEPLARLLARQRRESERTELGDAADPHVIARSVTTPQPVPTPTGPVLHSDIMLSLPGDTQEFIVRHMRRECGCYPDPTTPPDRWPEFLSGTPHNANLEHRVTVAVASGRIDADVVTNAQFARFLTDTGYRPACPDRFLHHWNGAVCPPDLGDRPVVYVDLDDARAYAAWAGKRLPTEWEWQRAAELHGSAFRHAEVHEWTESVRDDGHTRFVLLRGGCTYQARGSIWYFPGGPQPITAHAKFLLLYPGLDRCATIGFRCAAGP